MGTTGASSGSQWHGLETAGVALSVVGRILLSIVGRQAGVCDGRLWQIIDRSRTDGGEFMVAL